MAEYLADGSAREQALAKIVSGGELKLSYARSKAHLSARVTYQASRKLDSDEIEALREYTYGQLLDGVGESFQQAYARRPGRFWIAFEDIEYDELRATPSER